MSVCFQVSYSFSLFYLPMLDVRLCLLLYPDNKLKKILTDMYIVWPLLLKARRMKTIKMTVFKINKILIKVPRSMPERCLRG